jgi:hypothetical protein
VPQRKEHAKLLRIGVETLDFVADRSAVTRYYTPGTFAIVAPDTLLELQFFAVASLNFANNVRQQQPYRDAGGKFIIPIPEVKIV